MLAHTKKSNLHKYKNGFLFIEIPSIEAIQGAGPGFIPWGNTILHGIMFFSLGTCFLSLTQRTVNTLLQSSTELLETELSSVMALMAMIFACERSNGCQFAQQEQNNVPGPLLSWLSVFLGMVSTIILFPQNCALEMKELAL